MGVETKFAIDRNSGIGGSDVATILGFNKYKSREQLFLEKTGRGVEFKGNKYTERGEKYENSIAQWWKEKNLVLGDLKKPESLRSPRHPHLVANADFLTERGILEIKTSLLKFKDKWELVDKEGKDVAFNEVYWYLYYWQLLHYMVCFDAKMGNLCCQFFENERPVNEFYEATIEISGDAIFICTYSRILFTILKIRINSFICSLFSYLFTSLV
jgi:putative phage-type endonuclease